MPDDSAERKAWMSLLAKAPEARLADLARLIDPEPEHDWLRPPESGSVMVRGRAGATGEAFNLGEMTVTRCALRLASGEVGHAYVQGRSREKAKVAALVDALMQTERATEIRKTILDPLRAAASATARERAAKAAATKVDFFTMVRGEA